MANLIRSGKVKDVYDISTDELEFVFSDRVSVFDKIIPSSIPHKGETLARTSAYWFNVLKENGIPVHFLRLDPPNRMRVKKVDVIRDYSTLGPDTRNYLIPLEVITRYYVYGSLWDRVKSAQIKPEQLGFATGHQVKQAEPLAEPFFEVTTKLEKVDRNLSKDEALKISGLTETEYADMKELCLKIDGHISSRVAKRGLMHVDGKKEFAFDKDRKLMVIDTFGTADEDRFWDAKEFEQGRYVKRSKEFVRQFYRNSGYHAQLMRARQEKGEEPPIPALPQDMVKQVSDMYVALFEAITGQQFR